MIREVAVILLLAFAMPVRAASDSATEVQFRKAVEATSARDYDTALPLFESAIAADTENLRYASEYRQAAIASKQFDRSIAFFEKLVAEHTASGNAVLNLGYAYVDKIPVVGSISQVILANKALEQFSKAVKLEPGWLSYYTRGSAYLFWPKVFGRTKLGLADLQEAMRFQKKEPRCTCHVRTFIALGDGYWKLNELRRARSTWKQGLKQFPGNEPLTRLLQADDQQLKVLLDDVFDPNNRVDTDLRPLWANQ